MGAGRKPAVARYQDTLLTKKQGYGKAGFPSKNATPETLYYVGSTTKSFTAASILLLVEDSRRNGSNLPRLELTTPVSSIIRDEFVLPDTYATAKATLEDLLTHRTGMPRHDLSYGESTLRGYVENLRHLPMTADLRTTWQYCNMMYTTLAYIIEKLTSTSYPEFVRTRILAPLSMANTFGDVDDALARAPHHLSTPYYWDNATKSFVEEPYLRSNVLYGAGNILSSVSDYAKYLHALLARRPNFFPSQQGFSELRKARMLEAVEEDYAPWSGPPLYGLAWTRQSYRGLELFSHNGAVTGYGASMAYAPKAGWAVAVMANTEMAGNAAADRVLYALLDGLVGTPVAERKDWVKHYDGLVEEARRKQRRARAILYPDAPGAHEALPLRLPLQRYAGRYAHPGYGELVFDVVDGHAASPFGHGQQASGQAERTETAQKTTEKHLHASVSDKTWEYELCLEHVSGEFFMAWTGPPPHRPNALFMTDMPKKAAFQVGVSGKVERLLVAFEPKMGDEMIIFERMGV
ncbi:Beta-lactamase-related protein [Macrophomina phaseolina MS6]|uniref:Beta-lactamase-related protein n=1 Tax=Macrophomina phaseolina (strain MS6) TaxID=1126212 RepID=K2S6X4_MACPH|nr:Beta-lactamase-related protein [Macrophomina phaseolina MS6]